MLVPDPPPEFAALVRKELDAARGRALTLMPLKTVVTRTRVRRPPKGSCSKCGCHYDEYTHGCQACSNRHAMRRKLSGMPKLKTHCTMCGIRVEEVNPDCRRCRGRDRMRQKRAASRVRA